MWDPTPERNLQNPPSSLTYRLPSKGRHAHKRSADVRMIARRSHAHAHAVGLAHLN